MVIPAGWKMMMTDLRKETLFAIFLGLLCVPFACGLPQEKAAPASGTITQRGVTVQFEAGSGPLIEGEQALVRFTVSEATGTPLSGSKPAVWIDSRSGKTADEKQCHDKINSFLQASLGTRPLIDLNSYYVLTLNDDASISVIDPLLGFGSSKLFTMVMLRSPGMDWVMTRDGRRLFVSMPASSQVAVVDLTTWKIIANVDAGTAPTRITLQKDERYLWVGNDGQDSSENGVTVIDTATLKPVTRISAGAGRHEMAFSDDGRYVFVTSRSSGTLSVIDTQKRVTIKEIKTGPAPVPPAFSGKSNAVYVASEEDGSVLAIDAVSLTVRARMAGKAGVKSLRFASDGRWGFVANPQQDTVRIFDAASNQFVHTVAVENGPQELAFSAQYAYIRARGSEHVSMVPLSELGGTKPVVPADFPGGQLAPGQFSSPSAADTIVPSPESGAVLVANAADKSIYYYSEGMAAPMGNFQNYGRAPRAVLVADRSLRETAPGAYTAMVTLPQSGTFDVAFLLDSPQVVHCFELTVLPNRARKKQREVALKIEPMAPEAALHPGETFHLRFKVSDPETGEPRAGLSDINVLTFLAPGVWQNRQWARPAGEGVYEVEFAVPQPGAYYIFWECPSLGVRYNQISPLILTAAGSASPPAQKAQGAVKEEPAPDSARERPRP